MEELKSGPPDGWVKKTWKKLEASEEGKARRANLARAADDVAGGGSVRGAARRHSVPESSLRRHLGRLMAAAGISREGAGPCT